MKNQLFIALFWLISLSVMGQSSDYYFASREYESKPKIGLALSGGAAHGLAHIGVIQYLDEIGIQIDNITGTSMGAIIGALHAMGNDGGELEEIASGLDWNEILNNTIQYRDVAPVEKYYHDKYPLSFVINDRRILLPRGFLNTNKLELVLARLCMPANEVRDFSELPIPFKCFGVDIEKGKVVELKEGRLDQALRASMAIPSVFSPQYYNGQWLVDGGLIRNFPIEDNFEMGSDIVIGSFVGREKAEMSEMENLLDILSESAFMMSMADSEEQKDAVDVLLCPDVKNMDVFDFDAYQKLVQLGYDAAKEQHNSLLEIKRIQDQYEESKKIIPLAKSNQIYIDSINIVDVPLADQKLIRDKFNLKPRSYVSLESIERGIARVASTLNFESVTYQITKHEDATNTIEIFANPREQRNLGININRFYTTNASLILNGQYRNFLFRLSNLWATIRLSGNVGLSAGYYLRGGPRNKNWVFGLRGKIERSEQNFFSRGNKRKSGFLWGSHIIPYITYELNNVSSINTQLDFRRFDYTNELRAEYDLKNIANSTLDLSVEYKIDTRNERVLAKSGSLLSIKGGYRFNSVDDPKFNDEERTDLEYPVNENGYNVELLFSHTTSMSDNLWWTFMGDVYFISNASLLDNYKIGGTGLLSKGNLPFIGYREAELEMDRHVYVRTDLRVDLFDNVSLAIVANVITGRSEVFRYTDTERDHNLTAYGVGFELGVVSPVGPLLLDVGYNSESEDAFGAFSLGWKHIF